MTKISEILRADSSDHFNLAAIAPSATPDSPSKKKAKKALKGHLSDRLFDLHEMLMAEEDRSLLLVLQGSDASGKSGTIKHVIRAVNPAGVSIAGFVEPTEEEEKHHFLWRIKKSVPEAGMLGVFDRSHYEDVLVPRAESALADGTIEKRLKEILKFETELADAGTVIVKCFLHISYDEQRHRFLRRLRRSDKRWKFNEKDLDNRELWHEYQASYSAAIRGSDTDIAPWYVVPADHKWYRNWAIANLLIETLEGMDLSYPEPDLDVEMLEDRLEPPG